MLFFRRLINSGLIGISLFAWVLYQMIKPMVLGIHSIQVGNTLLGVIGISLSTVAIVTSIIVIASYREAS